MTFSCDRKPPETGPIACRLSFQSSLAKWVSLFFLASLLVGCGTNPKFEFKKAVQQYKNRNPVDAIKHLRRTIAAEPEFVPAYLLLGRIAAGEEDDQSAEINYRNAYDIIRRRDFKLRAEDLSALQDPSLRLEWQEAANFLADAEFKNENYNRAQRYYDAILDHEQTSAWKKRAHEGKQVMREFFGYRNKLQSLRQENISNPDDPRVKAELAALFMDMASALSRLMKLKAVSNYIAMSTEWRGQAQAKLEDVYKASPEPRLLQTEALLSYTESQEALMRGHYDRALEKAREACEKDDRNAKYHFAVASIIRVVDAQDEDSVDNTDEVIAYAKKAVELDPKVWRYLVFYAGQLQDLGQLKDSFDVLMRVRQVTSDEAVLEEVEEMLAALEEAMAAEDKALEEAQY